ncbi:MAG: mevalonate kinase [Anaerolineae bacterium]|nr:mevalonate kinase [Anaerolineae bacterium]
MTVGRAPGKVILLGEHAVVYGQPAIAVPVTQVQATATVEEAPAGTGVTIIAADLGRRLRLSRGERGGRAMAALARTVRNTLQHLGQPADLDLRVTVSSTIPSGRGLGSGAAVATAVVRALTEHLGGYLTSRDVSDLVYQTELLHHGTPSGIDNTVIAFGKPVYFIKGRCDEIFWPGRPFWLLVGDTGVPSSTREVVADVRRRWQAEREAYEAHFAAIGALVRCARQALIGGNLPELGRLMDANQRELAAIGTSSPALDRLIGAALDAGALGAKLSGSGRGGNMIALVDEALRDVVAAALRRAGARGVIVTQVS